MSNLQYEGKVKVQTCYNILLIDYPIILDGGSEQPSPPYKQEVMPGIDFEFPNNSFAEYPKPPEPEI